MFGSAPIPTTTTSAGTHFAGCSSCTPVTPLESPSTALTPVSMRRSTPCRRCSCAEDRSDLVADRHVQRHGLPAEHGDRVAVAAGRRRHLEPDPAGADDDDARAARAPAPSRSASDSPTVRRWCTPIRSAPGPGSRRERGAGRQQQLVVVQPSPSSRLDAGGRRARSPSRWRPRSTRTSCSAYQASVGCTKMLVAFGRARSGTPSTAAAGCTAVLRLAARRCSSPRRSRLVAHALSGPRAGESAADDHDGARADARSRPVIRGVLMTLRRLAQDGRRRRGTRRRPARSLRRSPCHALVRRAAARDLRTAQRHALVLGLEHDPDPAGAQLGCSQSATCWVSRSCTCRSRAKYSSTRANFDRPRMRSPGR